MNTIKSLASSSFDLLPRCNRCAHYYITHDVNFRYGCRALGFKSGRQPSLDVIEASGLPCMRFLAKNAKDAEGSC